MLNLVCFLSVVVLASAQFGNQFNNFQQQQNNRVRDPSLARILSDKRAHTVAGDFAVAFKQEDGTEIKEEARSSDGVRRGSYSYFDDSGKPINVEWQAGPGGFQILNANHLSAAPQLTPAQQQATAEHARAHSEAAARAAKNPDNQFNDNQFNQQQFNPAPQQQFNQQQFQPRPQQQAPVFNSQFNQQQFQPQPQQFQPQHQQFQPRPAQHFAQPAFSGNNDVPALTPEVAAARAEHLRAHQQALQAAQSAAATAKPEQQQFQQQPQQFQPQPQQFQPQPQFQPQQFQPKPAQFQPKQNQFQAFPNQIQPFQQQQSNPSRFNPKGNIQLTQNQNGFQYSLTAAL